MHVGVSEMLYKKGSTKGFLSSLTKKKVMAIDKDHFPPLTSINTASFNLRALIETKKVGKLSLRKVWVPKYFLLRVDKLKNEWSAGFIDPPSGRNSVKGMQQGIEQHKRFSKEMRLTPKGKMDFPGGGFVPPREKATTRPTPPRGRFTALRENDAGGSKNIPQEIEHFP